MKSEIVVNEIAADPVTDLNTKGIQLLKESEFGKGAAIFLEALMLLLTGAKDIQQRSIKMHTPVDVLAQGITASERQHAFASHRQDSCPTRRRQRDGEKRSIYSVAIPNRDRQLSTLSNDVYQFFDRAIDVEQRNFLDCSATSLLMIGVLSYNVGLAYHLGGIYLCKSSLFTSALEYYSMSFRILDDMLENATAVHGIGIMTKLPLLAALNNIGHIHAYQCSYSFAEEYCEEIAYHLESAGNTKLKILGTEEETEIFLQNACFYPRTEEISAAAA